MQKREADERGRGRSAARSRRGRVTGRVAGLLATLGMAVLPLPVLAAESVYLYLTVDGQEIQGDVTQAGRENSIECLSLSDVGFTNVDPATGAARGRVHRPLTITKPIDRASPLLQLAWSRVSNVDSAELRFYRPNPQNGSIQHYYTILLEGGYVASVSTHSPDVLDPATANRPATEEVTFVFQTITWTYGPTGATAQDTWGAR